MKRHSVFYVIFLSLCVAFCALSCQKTPEKIVVLKFATHPALDELESAFVSRINESMTLGSFKRKFALEILNANGNPQRAKQLAEISTRSDVRLLVTIATPMAQAVAKTPSSIPHLYGAVADPEGAGVIPSTRSTGIRNAGPAIIRRALQFIHTAFPEAKRLGSLYNPSEQNSVFVQKHLAAMAPEFGFQLVQILVTDPTQIGAATEGLVGQVDVVYSANDNTVNMAATSVAAVCASKKKPFVIGDLSTLSKGAVAAIGLEYASMGRDLADMAILILTNDSIASVPPRDTPQPSIWLNGQVLRKIGLELSPEAVRMASKTIE